jgi:hypothetical protein
VRLYFNVLCFSFIFFTMVYSVEQNTFIVVFYFRSGRFINGELSVCKNEFQQKEMMEKTPQISVAYLSQQSGVPRSTCHKIIKNRQQLHPYKIMYKNSNLLIIKVLFNIVIGFKITSVSEFRVLRICTNLLRLLNMC